MCEKQNLNGLKVRKMFGVKINYNEIFCPYNITELQKKARSLRSFFLSYLYPCWRAEYYLGCPVLCPC